MPVNVDAVYFWDNDAKIRKKSNIELGNLVVIFFAFWNIAIFLYIMAKVFYPMLFRIEKQNTGTISGWLQFLKTLTHYWWSGLILFIVAFIVITLLTLLVTVTKPRKLIAYVSYIQYEAREDLIKDKISSAIRSLVRLYLYSIIIFALLELFTLCFTFVVLALIFPLLIEKIKILITLTVMISFIIHIVIFPSFIALYARFISSKANLPETINLEEFLDETGEIDYKKWRDKTWGKKPYSYNWKEEEYIPLICPSCGSVISSNLTICPICKANLEEAIEELQQEMGIEDLIEEQQSEDTESVNKKQER
ncbi:MAG: hypothetical protein ACTSYD_00585 [Candidatus Heimdallarchaeaceae archaeon]